jgi:predicted cobalt transporter CbtA
VLGSIAAVCLVVAAGLSPNLPIFTRTWAKLSRRFGVLTALGVATVLGVELGLRVVRLIAEP